MALLLGFIFVPVVIVLWAGAIGVVWTIAESIVRRDD